MQALLQILESLWRPAVEITILAVGIYYVLTFVRGTRGAAIITGFLVVLLTLAFVARILDLVVLRSLIGSFTAFLAIAVLVIFQPEVRRMLAQLGNVQVFGSAHQQRENIEVIIQTVERLADVRIGALMAIEQTIQLRESVESGIPVDCVATPEMLETIFFPNNAIHDGGVIIKGDRIAYAACIFPLTRRQDLNKSLGTRHRAAIGLSEETDAIIVVVSEETGAISYVHNGHLTRGVSLEELRAFLTSLLVPVEKPRTLADWFRPTPRKPAAGTARATPAPVPLPSSRPAEDRAASSVRSQTG